MSGSDKTAIGDRIKLYEGRTNLRLLPSIPIVARIDGRSFSKFTQGLARPYDIRLSKLMVNTTQYLVKETNARCGYTQSDEITLVWLEDDIKQHRFFAGKLLKMTSVVASMATAFFNKHLTSIPEKQHLMPVFDNRVFEVPSEEEAVNCFVWREMDAVRNSIQGAARTHFSHKQCLDKNGSELQEMLFQKGVNWNDYPEFFKRGTYVRKRVTSNKFTASEIDALPPKHLARTNPDLVFERSIVVAEALPPITKITNKVGVILRGEEPVLA